MEEKSESKSSEEIQRVSEGRRKLLKVLVASGGAFAAATLLPGKWVKPVIDWGVLPLHAQVSPPVRIDSLELLDLGPPQPTGAARALGSIIMISYDRYYKAIFNYMSSGGLVTPLSTYVFLYTSPTCGEWPYSAFPLGGPGGLIAMGIATQTGTPSGGTISAIFGRCPGDTEVSLHIGVDSMVGIISNSLGGPLTSMMTG